ncbi:TPA: hypothetical protein DCZ32_04725, partial [Candidatus Uhrbacteria bacterium]|nr:hypothetical protein [Candidatus Uhrbacteria bacterium]
CELEKVKAGAGISGETDLPRIVGKIIGIFLSVLGVIFVVLTVYAGFLWMTAQGSDEKVKKAQKMLSQGVIGIVIIVLAYAISNFVVSKLSTL